MEIGVGYSGGEGGDSNGVFQPFDLESFCSSSTPPGIKKKKTGNAMWKNIDVQ